MLIIYRESIISCIVYRMSIYGFGDSSRIYARDFESNMWVKDLALKPSQKKKKSDNSFDFSITVHHSFDPAFSFLSAPE